MNNMDRTVKGTIAVVLCAIIVAVAAYGSYLPLRKAQTFIATLQSLQRSPVSSIAELETRLSPPLDYPSPIGQEEIVRNMANSVLSFVQRSQDASTTAALVGFLNTYFDPILERGKGMSFGQDVYLEGAINEISFSGTGDPRYLAAAEHYYSEAHELGPNRPQALYGLFDIYRAEGDVTNTKMIANQIIANWPEDMQIRQAVSAFLGPTQGAAPAKK
jgi:hypothetical protein